MKFLLNALLGFNATKPSHLYFEILTPWVIVVGTRACERQLGHRGGTLMNGIIALTKEP